MIEWPRKEGEKHAETLRFSTSCEGTSEEQSSALHEGNSREWEWAVQYELLRVTHPEYSERYYQVNVGA